MAEPNEVVRLAAAVGRAARAGDVEAERAARSALALAKVRVVLEAAAKAGVTFTADQIDDMAGMIGDDGLVHLHVGGRVSAVNGVAAPAKVRFVRDPEHKF